MQECGERGAVPVWLRFGTVRAAALMCRKLFWAFWRITDGDSFADIAWFQHEFRHEFQYYWCRKRPCLLVPGRARVVPNTSTPAASSGTRAVRRRRRRRVPVLHRAHLPQHPVPHRGVLLIRRAGASPLLPRAAVSRRCAVLAGRQFGRAAGARAAAAAAGGAPRHRAAARRHQLARALAAAPPPKAASSHAVNGRRRTARRLASVCCRCGCRCCWRRRAAGTCEAARQR